MSTTTRLHRLAATPSVPTTRANRERRGSRRRLLGRVTALGAAVLMASGLAVATRAAAAQAPVGLGTASSFAVLAGSGVTNTGPTTINGDVGTFPTPSETGFGSITLIGTNHADDAVTQGAKNDLVTAYNDAAGRGPATNIAVELGGSTLTEGVYTSPTLGLTGTLSLDAAGDPNAVFVFQAGSTLITASNSRVLLLNGASPCNVYWQIGSSATFNTATAFIGNVLVQASITAQTAATFQGRLLARDGAVTLDTNTITNGGCVTGGGTTNTSPEGDSAGSTTGSGGSGSSTTGGAGSSTLPATGATTSDLTLLALTVVLTGCVLTRWATGARRRADR